jgi:hypothetical protein
MASYTSFVKESAEQVLDAAKSVQRLVLSTVSNVCETVGEYVPELPEIPFSDQIPTARETTNAYFDLAEDWMKSQREYSLGLIDAVSPVTDKLFPAHKSAKPRPAKASAKAA